MFWSVAIGYMNVHVHVRVSLLQSYDAPDGAFAIPGASLQPMYTAARSLQSRVTSMLGVILPYCCRHHGGVIGYNTTLGKATLTLCPDTMWVPAFGG